MVETKHPKMGSMFGGQASGGLFDIPLAQPGEAEDADIVVMGAPSATPYESVGAYCADAPDAIRSAFGWPGVLNHHDFDLGGKVFADGTKAVDWGNLDYSDKDYAFNRNTILRSVKTVLDQGAVPIVMGGDDSIPIPVFQAFEAHGPLTIVQLDAHIDWRDEVSGERLGLSSNMRRASEMAWVDGIIQLGARGLGSARPQDFRDATEWGVQFFPMQDIVNMDFGKVIEAVPADRNVFVTLDIDAMDPAIVPSVIGPAPGGSITGRW
nr:arginase family protein [Pelagibius sp. Alg239-R121]